LSDQEQSARPEYLPREVHTHKPTEDACPDCGGQLRKLGEDISKILERVPASYKVIRYARLKVAFTKCDIIVEAPAPPKPIERGRAGPALLAHVFVSKYADHFPLYRQSEIFAREGIAPHLLTRWAPPVTSQRDSWPSINPACACD
jgi:transposase